MTDQENIQNEEKINTSNKDQVATALAKAQGEFPVIKKDKKVTVKTRTGGSYQFAYAPLDSMREQTRPILSRNGLCIVQHEENGLLVTTLYHTSGQSISNAVRLIYGSGNAQEYGSALTYARRYGYSSLLGIASEEDDDANVAVGNSYEDRSKKQPAAPIVEPAEQVLADAFASLESASSLSELQDYFKATYKMINEHYPRSQALKKVVAKKDELKQQLSEP